MKDNILMQFWCYTRCIVANYGLAAFLIQIVSSLKLIKKVPIDYKCRANSTLRGQPVIYISHRVRILRDQVENITNYQLNENILKYVGIYFEKTFFETMGCNKFRKVK
ncbi:hypothetical protein GQX74_014523 [Glossina fuscipes]|nr:hypothetical protein GQX74_014523 [Glossina fuscipes]